MPTINVQGSGWHNVYALAGIEVGAGLYLQNQTSYTLIAVESAAQPAANENGRWIYPTTEVQIDSGSPGLWVRPQSGTSIRAFVQERG